MKKVVKIAFDWQEKICHVLGVHKYFVIKTRQLRVKLMNEENITHEKIFGINPNFKCLKD